MRLQSILGLLLSSTLLLSCDKDNGSEPAPIQEAQFSTLSFRYDTGFSSVKEFELIIAQQDGKVLLDTLIASGTQHVLKLKSDEKLFDITTVLLDKPKNKYYLKTYTQVNPDKWHLMDGFTTVIKYPLSEVDAEVHYTNLPYDPHGHIRPLQFTSITQDGPGLSGRMTASFKRTLPTDLVYLLLPNHGKYLFTEVTQNITKADFSEAKASVKRKYSRPANSTRFMAYLYGHLKAGDYSKQFMLYATPTRPEPSQEYDLQFPTSVIEEFELVIYYNKDGYQYRYEHIGPSVPETMAFAQEADFTVTNTDFNDFQIAFGEDKPSTYMAQWLSTDPASLDVYWEIHSSSGKTSYRPKTMLNGLKPKLLTGKTIPALELDLVQTKKPKGFDHQAYFNYLGNPEARKKKEIRENRTISRSF